LGALSRADVIVLTKTDLGNGGVEKIKARLGRLRMDKVVVEAVHCPVAFTGLRFGEALPLSSVEGKDVCLFCSLGDPRSFVRTLENLGARIKRVIEFPDHHRYRPEDVRRINGCCLAEGINILVTTEKDSVKLTSFLGLFDDTITILCLRIEIKITRGEDEFLQRITHLS
jgi:tetraacyldisaccharide 4'-kinase